MQIETIDKYQLHLIAHELPNGRWDPFVEIFKFDDTAQDFKCVQPRQRVGNDSCASYAEAIEAARCAGSVLMHPEAG